MKYDYYTPEQSQQFAFYCIPQVLFTNDEFSALSTNAKLLYGLLLDRMNLSVKNGWIDKNNHAYISLKIETASEMMKCSEKTCSKLFVELEKTGLIKRTAKTFGRPSLIYVMNFIKKDSTASDQESYDYFSSKQSQQFTFYRVPKVLFTDVKYFALSTDAKLLYSLLLDRMSLSFKYKWIDSENHVFINFKVEEAEKLLQCSKRKISSLFSELRKKGLIKQQLQGLNKPARIYVMNFIRKTKLFKAIIRNAPIIKACRKKSKSLDTQILPIGHANFTDMDTQILPIGHANFTDWTRKFYGYGHANFTDRTRKFYRY